MSPDASNRLVEVLAALQDVSDREQLLDWADAKLRRLIGFSSMACMMAEPHGRGYRIRDVIASGEAIHCLGASDDDPVGKSTVPSPVVARATRRPNLDLDIAEASHALIDRWMQDRRALQMSVSIGHDCAADVAPLLDCFDVESIVMHGVKEAFSGSATFFLLGASGAPLGGIALDVLNLLMPSLHIARQRIYRTDRAQGQHRPAVGLTAREIRILSMIADGKTDEEAARTTGRSVHTIKNQVRHLVTKLGAKNRTQAVLIALRHELLHHAE